MDSSTVKIPLHLIPSPGAPDEFMAIIQPLITSDLNENDRMKVENVWNTMIDDIQQATSSGSKNKIVLEGYTRDGWAWKPNADHWVSMTIINYHENQQKKKLENFVKYLKERQKSAYGRFGTLGLFVVSYVQSSKNNNTSTDQIDCRISTDCTLIPNCTIVPLLPQSHDRPKTTSVLVAASLSIKDGDGKSTTKSTATVPLPAAGKVREKGAGFLGKLVGAQQRTNQHVVASKQPIARKVDPQQQRRDTGIDSLSSTANMGVDTTTHVIRKSAQEVIADFRQECHDKMLNFDLSDEEMIQMPIVLRDYTQLVSTEEDKLKISMDILKYIVFEAAEEVNEEWVAHKEPSEFMDDIIITIYKEGAAPDDVLEDINHAELPEEIRGQQRALQEQQQQQQRNNKKSKANELVIPFDEEYDDLEALNTNKRDRRTIEDYEREKRSKTR
jgi:hypothetical protein